MFTSGFSMPWKHWQFQIFIYFFWPTTLINFVGIYVKAHHKVVHNSEVEWLWQIMLPLIFFALGQYKTYTISEKFGHIQNFLNGFEDIFGLREDA